MAKILISYDLNAAGQDYQTLIDRIKALGSDWWHCLDSTWIVVTSLTAVQVRDVLAHLIDRNDELLVVDISAAPAAWAGFNAECGGWLQRNL